jgi:RHS repeat-associated protein
LSNAARSKSQFKYNGQEYQDELELNMTAMDFRQYDNALGRFHGVDLLAELDYSGSPYSFGFNNPVYFSDPSGLTPDPPVNKNNLINLDEVDIVRPPKRANGFSPFMDMSFAQISIGGVGNFGISDNGGGGGRNEIGVTMSALGLVALNSAAIEGARMKNVVGVADNKNPKSPAPQTGLQFSMKLMALWYEFGNRATLVLNASSINFSETSQTELNITNSFEPQLVNLFKSGINPNSLSFGKVWMTRINNTQFIISINEFNFEHRDEASFARNASTLLGGLLFGRFYESHPPYIPYISRHNYRYGGGYDVQFLGTVTIPR